MSTALPDRPTHTAQARGNFALVVSRYNEEFTSALATNAREELLAINAESTVTTHFAPGAFEIPLLVKLLAERGEFDAILALGVIIRGSTAHADLIAASITHSLQQISLEHRVPVLHEVLLVNDETQARQRCIEPQLNRGREAARAAVSAVQAVRAIAAS